MIIKNKGWKYAGFERLASYIFLGARREGEEHPHHSSLLWHNVKQGSLPETIAKNMLGWHNDRRYQGKNYKALNHTIISWSPEEDKKALTDETMYHLAQQYIKERCPDAMVFGGIHKEAGKHFHVHLLFCNTLGNGQSMRIERKEFEDCKQRMYAYQREHFPEIKHSYETKEFQEKKARGEYDKSVKKDNRVLYEMEKRGEGYLHESRKTLSAIIDQDHSSSLQFLRACRANGYKEYYRDKQGLYGFVINGKNHTYNSILLSKEQKKKFKRFQRQLKRMSLDEMVSEEEQSFKQGLDVEEQGVEWEFE